MRAECKRAGSTCAEQRGHSLIQSLQNAMDVEAVVQVDQQHAASEAAKLESFKYLNAREW